MKRLLAKYSAKLSAGGLLLLFLPALVLAQAENVCIKCHETLPGRLGDPVKLWRESIHAANGVACNECHGGDPGDAANAMSPDRGFIGVPQEKRVPDVCGRCHIGVKNDYLASAHGRALGKGGPTCVTCHSNHAVKKASIDLINKQSCSRCHDYTRASEIKNAMLETEKKITNIESGIDAFKNTGFDTETLEKRLFSQRNQYRSLFHDVDVQKIRNVSVQINGELAKLDGSLQKLREEQQKRKLIGAFAVGGTLLGALLFYLMRKTYD